MISSIPKWVSNLFESSMKPNAKVLETRYIKPGIKEIRFKGDIEKWNFQIGFASVVRVSETEFRNYTIKHYNKNSGIFDIIFHIHNNGVGSKYIDSLRIGDEIFISPPRGKNFYDPKVSAYLIFGDETSLGLAFSFLSTLKQNKHQFQFYFELDKSNKDVPELLGIENFTVYAKNNSFRDEDWVNNLPLFQSEDLTATSFVLTGNVKSVQNFRKILKDKKTQIINSQGYWLEGKKGL